MGQIGLSRRVKDINRLMVCHRLQAVTRIAVASIIDNQHRTAILCHLPCQRGDHQIGLRTVFKNHTIRRWTTCVCHTIHGKRF